MESVLSFLPSAPKRMIVDVLVIMCIIVLCLVLVVFAMKFLHLFVEPVVTPTLPPDRPMNVEVEIPSEATPGETIFMNVTLTNLGDNPVEGVKMRVPPSGALAGTEMAVGKLLPRASIGYTLEVEVRESAQTGPSEGMLEVSSLNYTTTEGFTIQIA